MGFPYALLPVWLVRDSRALARGCRSMPCLSAGQQPATSPDALPLSNEGQSNFATVAPGWKQAKRLSGEP